MNLFHLLANGPKQSFYDTNQNVSLDLAILTDNIIVSGAPSLGLVNRVVHNNVVHLVNYLNSRYYDWHIFDFQGEGCDYKDSDVLNKVTHFPFNDHEPPEFEMLLAACKSIDTFLNSNNHNDSIDSYNDSNNDSYNDSIDNNNDSNDSYNDSIDNNNDSNDSYNDSLLIAVLHCKNGKGRSGTIFIAYMMIYKGCTLSEANDLFTSKRMRFFAGQGVSIKSQLRMLKYLEMWLKDEYLRKKKGTKVKFKVRLINSKDPIYSSLNSYIEVSSISNIEVSLSNTEVSSLSNIEVNSLSNIHISVGRLAKTTFNLFFESAYSNTLVIKWEDFDGFYGTGIKGRKLFDSMQIEWEKIDSIE